MWAGKVFLTPGGVCRDGLVPVALLSIGASYLALSNYVTVVPRFWLPGLLVVVVVLLIAHAQGRYRLARTISFVPPRGITTTGRGELRTILGEFEPRKPRSRS